MRSRETAFSLLSKSPLSSATIPVEFGSRKKLSSLRNKVCALTAVTTATVSTARVARVTVTRRPILM